MDKTNVIDEYRLDPRELSDRLEPFLKDKGFIVEEGPRGFGFEFTEASTITDYRQNNNPCGRIIYYPWGGNNTGLHVFRGSRLEEAIKEYLK